MIKVWQITHEIMGGGYITEELSSFETDLEEELTCDAKYKKEDIEPFLEKVKALELWQSEHLYPWIVICKEMTREELENLPEFMGW